MKALIRSLLCFSLLSVGVAQGSLLDGLVAYYPMDGSAVDMSGNAHDGSVSGATPTNDRFGAASSAYQFNGTSYISVPDSPDFTFGANPFTVALWAKLDSLGNYYIIGHDEGQGNLNKWILWGGSTDLKFHTNSPSTGGQFPVTSGWSPAVNTWYHLAVTRSGQDYTLFIDGTPVGTATYTPSIPDPNAPLLIGTAEDGHPERVFRGALDDLRIYNRALSASEISQLSAVPVPAAAWLFGSALLGLAGIGRRRSLN